ncbi:MULTISPECIES: hypothetical protein [Oceanobacillus]|uniref:Uncharacterized protein n=1 Tax=Oceanobacillus aidingensis TaxID=645964 RepID=A0ABV9JUU4_9BACI|nr:hypothetical protein [Oceanobacillus oncorhynchi]MDM8102863.1 hypothetical protein [Oceanobacillus oncorhynchi]UUI41673.1 hypothetical protein NP440_09205 [Oceanobacillus oncorhynchi]
MKKYSWISYLSLGLPILLFLLLFAVADIEPLVLAQTILIAQLIGAPLSIILSVAALFKKNEKKVVAVFGLIISLNLTGALVYLLLLGFGMGEA